MIMESSSKWLPFKDLLEATENLALNKGISLQNLKLLLRKHKPEFFSLLNNQIRNNDDRKTVKLRSGMSVQGNLKIIDPAFIAEVLIISDMFELNELISFDLLLTGEQQKPNYTNYSRGLVAVMLYWDGKRNLVSALRTLIQCRKGNSWTLDLSEDATSLATSFTDELLSHGLIEQLLKLLENIQIEVELEKLSKQKGLGDSRHRKQVRDLITEVRQCLADCVFFAAAQSELPENDVITIIEHLRKHAEVDAHGKLSSTTLALLFALLYSIKISADAFTEEDGEDILRQSKLCEEDFMKRIHNELVDDSKAWKVSSVRSYLQLTWSLTLRLLSQSSLSSSFNLVINEILEQDEALLESALADRVFLSLKENVACASSFHNEEFYLRMMHLLITDLIVNMPLKVKEMRSNGDETARIIMLHLAEGREVPSERRRDFQHLMELITAVYDKDPLNLQLAADYWCVSEQSLSSDGTYVTSRRMPHKQMALFKFVRQSGDILPPLLYIPYLHMLSALSTGPRSARAAFELLRANGGNGDALISWEHFFLSCQRYFDNLRQNKLFNNFANPFVALQSPVVKPEMSPKVCTITPQEIEGLRAVMKLTAKIAQYDDIACLAFLEETHWCVCGVLFGLLQCPVPVLLKGDILLVLRQLARLPGVAVTLLQASEHSQLLRKQRGVDKLGGISNELEEIESRDEEYPMTRGFAQFTAALADSHVDSLGENFLRSLSFIIESVFLRLLSRAYAKPEEKWEVAEPCLSLFNKILAQYSPSPDDFVSERVFPSSQDEMSMSMAQAKPAVSHPGMSVLCYLYNEGDFFATVMEIIASCINYFESYVTKPNLERTLVAATEPAMQLLLHGLQLQEPFLNVLRNSGNPLLVTALDKIILGVNPKTEKADYILTLSRFVRHNADHPRLSLLAIEILSWLCSSSSHRQIITLVITTCDRRIREEVVNGFVEILDTGAAEASGDVEQSLVAQQREAILRLMLHCVDHPSPNFSHILLGFDSNKRLSQGNLQDPGVLGSSRSCLHSILSILSTNNEQPHAIKATPKLAELCYQLIYRLARNKESSEVVLRYLRSSHDFFYKHLQYLPFQTDGATNTPLMQQSWLLKTAAVELHLLASKQQRTNAQRLIQVLFNKSACAMDGSFSTIGQSLNQSERSRTGDVSALAASFLNASSGKTPSSKPAMLELFDIVDLSQDFPPPLSLDQFVLSVVEESIKSCETTNEHGVVFCDIKFLHHLLESSLSTLASEDMTRKRLADQDVQKILRTVVKRNEVRAAVHSKLHFLTSWKQVLEVILTSCPDDVLLKATRQQVVFTVLQHLVKAACDVDAAQVLTSSLAPVILTLSMQIRASVSNFNADHFSPNEELPQDVINTLSTFQVVVHGIIDWLLLSGINQNARVSLYGSLLYYLQLCNQTKKLDAGSRDFTCLRSLQEGIYSRLARENSRLFQDFGDSFKDLLCKDAFNGHSICRVLAYGCLDSILQSDTEQVWLQYMLKNGYLNHIANSFCDEDQPLQQYLNPATRPLRAVYIFEQKMALLCSIAHTPGGARAIINSQIFPELAKCEFLDMRPQLEYNAEAQSSLVLSRYRQLLFPVLHLCSSLLNALGGSTHHEACAVVLQFFLSHDQAIVMSVLRSNAFDQQSLSELCLVSGILCQVAGQDFTDTTLYPDIPQAVLMEIQANLLRIRRSLMHMLPNYLITDDIMSSLKERSEDNSSYETTTLTLHEIASNLLTYCRVIVTRSADADSILLFSPELSDSSPGISAYSSQLPRKPSLGILVKFLQISLTRHAAEKDQVKQLKYKLENIEKLNSQDLKEILGHSDDVMQLSVAQEQKIASMKLKQSISCKNKLTKCLLYIVETSLFLLWHHLNQYVSQAVSTGKARERILFPPKTPHRNTSRRLQDTSNLSNDEQLEVSKFEFSPIDVNQLKNELHSFVSDPMLKRLSSVETEGTFVQPLVRRIQRIKMLLN